MAMIFCPRCGKQISDKAPVCPHCNSQNPMFHGQQPQAPVSQPSPTQPQPAAPAKKSRTGPVIIAVIVIIAAVGLMVGLNYHFNVDKSDNDSSVPSTTKAVDEIIDNDNYNTANSIIDNSTPEQTQPPAAQPTTERKCSVHLIVESDDNMFMGTYLTNVKIDDMDPIFSIQDGDTKDIHLTLSPGTHTIKFEKSTDKTVFSEATAYINSDCKLEYYINCWPDSITVKER